MGRNIYKMMPKRRVSRPAYRNTVPPVVRLVILVIEKRLLLPVPVSAPRIEREPYWVTRAEHDDHPDR